MGMFLKLWALIMGMIMAFFSGMTPTKAYEPETVDINGVTYKNCFIPEYSIYHGMKASEDDPLYLIPGERESFLGAQKGWYAITDKIVSRGLYPNAGTESTGKKVYCLETDWDELKAFYGDFSNYNCYIGTKYLINGERIDDSKIDSQYYSNDLLNKIMQFTYDCSKKNIYKSTRLPDKYGSITSSFYIYMVSVDNLFEADTLEIVEHNGDFYKASTHYEGLYTEAFRFPDELQVFIRGLVEQYDNAVWHLPKI